MQKLSLPFLFMYFIGNLCFAFPLKGVVDKQFNSETDSVYVSLLWASDEGLKNESFNYEVGEIKNGTFNFEVNKEPHENILRDFRGTQIAAAYIIVFKDIDGDKRFTKNDKIIGLCEDHVMAYAEQDLKAAIVNYYKTEKNNSKPDKDILKRFEHWKKGLHLYTKLNPKKKKKYKEKYRIIHDVLIPDGKREIFIRTSDNLKKSNIKPPNWI